MESQGCTEQSGITKHVEHFNSITTPDALGSACLIFQELFFLSASPKSTSLRLTTAAGSQ